MGYSVLLVFVLAGSFLTKAPFLNEPLLGHFGSYQVMNGMMAKMMNWDSLDSLFIPQSFVIIDGKPALHLLYYPFSSFFAAFFHLLTGANIDFCGRFQSSMCMLLAAVALYFVVKRIYDSKIATLACTVFSFSPMVLVSGISFQNEAAATLFLILAFCFALSDASWKSVLSGLLFSSSVIARLHFLAFLPAFILILLQSKRSVKCWIIFFLGFLLPLAAWCALVWSLDHHATNIWSSFFRQSREGRFLISSLLTSGDFYKRILEILVGEALTPVMLPFLVLGFFGWDLKRLPFQIWFLGSLSTIFILPQKTFQHSFYLIGSIPAASVLIAIALNRLTYSFSKSALMALWITFFFFAFRYFLPPTWSSVIEKEKQVTLIGEEIKKITSENDWIIGAYGSSAALLYYADRLGWGFDLSMTRKIDPDIEAKFPHKEWFWQAREKGYGDPVLWLEYLRKQGAKYLVIGIPGEFWSRENFAEYVTARYQMMNDARERFLVFDLTATIA